jgi:hypothetical protein
MKKIIVSTFTIMLFANCFLIASKPKNEKQIWNEEEIHMIEYMWYAGSYIILKSSAILDWKEKYSNVEETFKLKKNECIKHANEIYDYFFTELETLSSKKSKDIQKELAVLKNKLNQFEENELGLLIANIAWRYADSVKKNYERHEMYEKQIKIIKFQAKDTLERLKKTSKILKDWREDERLKELDKLIKYLKELLNELKAIKKDFKQQCEKLNK